MLAFDTRQAQKTIYTKLTTMTETIFPVASKLNKNDSPTYFMIVLRAFADPISTADARYQTESVTRAVLRAEIHSPDSSPMRSLSVG